MKMLFEWKTFHLQSAGNQRKREERLEQHDLRNERKDCKRRV